MKNADLLLTVLPVTALLLGVANNVHAGFNVYGIAGCVTGVYPSARSVPTSYCT